MNKIAIVGSPGAGKSTLAQQLGKSLNLEIIHLDRLFWQRGWERKDKDTRIDILQGLVREKQWIIEGTYLSSSELHLNAADIIIFLDIPPFVCLWRLVKRHFKYHRCSRRDIPMGCTDKLTLLHMLKVMTFPLHDGRRLKQKLRSYKSKRIIWLRSRKEVEDFLAQQGADEKRNASSTFPGAIERPLLATGQ
jgi:adenylate kinase family enzyme